MVDRNLTERLAAAARSMRSQHDVQGTLQRAVELAPEVIKGCDQAGVSMVRARKRVDTPGATDDVVRKCDQIQYELNRARAWMPSGTPRRSPARTSAATTVGRPGADG